MAITRGAENLVCGEEEGGHDADVLLSLSVLIKARVLWIVFEGIFFFQKKKEKKDAPIKVCVLRASEGSEKSLSTPVLKPLCRS